MVVTVVLTEDQIAALAVKSGDGSSFDVTVPGKLTLAGASCTLVLTTSVRSQIASTIKDKGCLSGSKCDVTISAPKLCGKSVRKLRGGDQDQRELQTTGDLVLEFELTMKTYCQNAKCEDAQTVANAVYNIASAQLQAAIQDNSLLTALQSTISTLTGAAATLAALVAPFIDLLDDWYPNWHGSGLIHLESLSSRFKAKFYEMCRNGECEKAIEQFRLWQANERNIEAKKRAMA